DDATLTASAADTVSATQDLTGAYQASAKVRITNGGTGPTVAAQCRVQVAEADTAAKFMTLATCQAGVTNSGVFEWVVIIPDPSMYVRFVSGSNTGQNVTLRVTVERITAL
ncbi:MAG TPA: hypothetical protein VLL76_04740, partial [Candidatus Omnitrophota bacterium]|nr:hypothetical protein [Candidatus Omnitrophota bacterium]